MLRCFECNSEFLTLAALTQHLRRIHVLTQEAYYLRHALKGEIPVCACGCGKIVSRFYNLKVGYPSFVFGHQNLEQKIERVVYPLFDDVLLKCDLCSESFCYEKHLDNHLQVVHGSSTLEQFVLKNHGGKHPTCGCGCGEKLTFYGLANGFASTYIKGHSPNPVLTKESHAKGSATRKHRFKEGMYKVWNDGLTKETDERILRSAEKARKTRTERYTSGLIVPWQRGKSKETDDRVLRISKTKERMFKEGNLRVWNKGLTKETSEKLAIISRKNTTKA